MRYSSILFVGLVCGVLSSVLGSYEAGYASSHDHDDDYYEPSYPAPPIVHPHHGHSAGSYYHYHVPLVGQQQQQHYQPAYHQPDHSHYLWPLLLLLALPLLFLPLLPLLLLPLGISLLALLMPGGMMMMMMMMMMGGGMMMRTDGGISGRAFNEMRTFGDVILNDMTSLLSKYARSLDLDQCPQRIACEMGAIFFPETNSSDTSTAKAFSSLIMEQYLPKGKVKKTIKLFEKAFWTGSTRAGICSTFQCHPTFKIYNKHWNGNNGKDHEVTGTRGSSVLSGASSSSSASSPSLASPTSSSATSHFNGSRVEGADYRTKTKHVNVNYVYPSSKVNDDVVGNNYLSLEGESTKPEAKLKTKRSHYYNNPNKHHVSFGKHQVEDIHIPSATTYNRKTTLYKMFGTPTVKS